MQIILPPIHQQTPATRGQEGTSVTMKSYCTNSWGRPVSSSSRKRSRRPLKNTSSWEPTTDPKTTCPRGRPMRPSVGGRAWKWWDLKALFPCSHLRCFCDPVTKKHERQSSHKWQKVCLAWSHREKESERLRFPHPSLTKFNSRLTRLWFISACKNNYPTLF